MGAGLFRDSYAQWRGNPISENCDLLWPFENKCAFTGTCVESGIGDYGICMCGPYWTDPSSVVALLSDLSWSTCTISTPLYLIIHLFGLIGSIILAYYAIEKFKKVVVYTALQAMLQECDISEEGPIREYFKSIPEFRPKVMVFVEKVSIIHHLPLGHTCDIFLRDDTNIQQLSSLQFTGRHSEISRSRRLSVFC